MIKSTLPENRNVPYIKTNIDDRNFKNYERPKKKEQLIKQWKRTEWGKDWEYVPDHRKEGLEKSKEFFENGQKDSAKIVTWMVKNKTYIWTDNEGDALIPHPVYEVRRKNKEGQETHDTRTYSIKQILWDKEKVYQKSNKSLMQSQNEVLLRQVATSFTTKYFKDRIKRYADAKELIETVPYKKDDYRYLINETIAVYVNKDKYIPKELGEIKNGFLPPYIYVISEKGCGNLNNLVVDRLIEPSIKVILDFEMMLDLAEQAINAVFHLHSLGIAHRHVNIHNYIVSDLRENSDNNTHRRLSPKIKLDNFQYCKEIDKMKPFETPINHHPDQGKYDESVDIWGLGQVLYHIFSGYITGGSDK